MRQKLKNIIGFCTFGAALLLSSCGSSSGGVGSSPPRASSERLVFLGVGLHGIFDPAVALDSASGRLWMSYSAVDPSVSWPTQNVDGVAIRLAYSDDNGKTWNDSGTVVSNFLDVNLPLAPPNNAGTWVNEVSQIIYDSGAIAKERWKLLWHHYLIINGYRHFEHGWIAMKMASTPGGLATATEIKLFTSAGYDVGNNIPNNLGTYSPVGGPPVIQLAAQVLVHLSRTIKRSEVTRFTHCRLK